MINRTLRLRCGWEFRDHKGYVFIPNLLVNSFGKVLECTFPIVLFATPYNILTCNAYVFLLLEADKFFSVLFWVLTRMKIWYKSLHYNEPNNVRRDFEWYMLEIGLANCLHKGVVIISKIDVLIWSWYSVNAWSD